MTVVYMRQVGRFRWQLESSSGNVLKDDLLMQDIFQAETWAKQYVSSFPAWTIVLKPKEEEIPNAKP